MANTYDVGDRVDIETDTVFQDSSGVAFDPNVVRFRVKDPSGTTEVYANGVDSEVTHNGVGDYTCTIDVDLAGWWYYRIEGEQNDGENRGADEGEFWVVSSTV